MRNEGGATGGLGRDRGGDGRDDKGRDEGHGYKDHRYENGDDKDRAVDDRADEDRTGEDRSDRVGALGEAGVLRRILAHLGAARAAAVGPGDDCAVLGFDGQAVVTTDTMIEGPDFRLDWHSGFELGWKLAATNLSDVAAMGAVPVALTVALACPAETPAGLLEEIARGLDAACRALAPGCGVVGGDLGRAPVLTAAVTALGELSGRQAVLRSGARVGDTVAYAGHLGLSGLGFSLLSALDAEESSVERSSVEESSVERRGIQRHEAEAVAELRVRHPLALRAHLAPQPPVRLGPIAALAGATAMLDVSDGLALDAARIGRASRVSLDLDPGLLRDGFGEQGEPGATERVPLERMLFGGEDHGLLATFPAGTALPPGFLPVGAVVPNGGVGPGGVLLGGEPIDPGGWDPFARARGSGREPQRRPEL